MDIQALKLDLVEKIIHTEKTSTLFKIKDLLQDEKADDWWEDLPVEVQESIFEGMQDIKDGKVFTHEEIISEAKQKYGF
jgi:predicted transcriptional regulator